MRFFTEPGRGDWLIIGLSDCKNIQHPLSVPFKEITATQSSFWFSLSPITNSGGEPIHDFTDKNHVWVYRHSLTYL